MLNDDFIWVEKYRPKLVKDTILPEDLKEMFQEFVNQGSIPNMLLYGPPGCGKTTVARAMLEELECDYMIMNGSLEGRLIETLRDAVMSFASSVSFTGRKKYIIVDEADYLNKDSVQPAMRAFMEEFSKNCGFIFTCNNKVKIIEAIHSRCTVIDFKIPKKVLPTLAQKFMKRVCNILDLENIAYDKASVAEVIKKHFPDWRRVINELQRYSAAGKIDSGILSSMQEGSVKSLVGYIKEKNFTEARKWAAENTEHDATRVYRSIFEAVDEYVVKSSIPELIILIAKYQYQAAFCADLEVNLVAFIAECMVAVEFK